MCPACYVETFATVVTIITNMRTYCCKSLYARLLAQVNIDVYVYICVNVVININLRIYDTEKFP